jgi:hypothetical protein
MLTPNAPPSRLYTLGCGVLLLAVAYVFFERLIIHQEDNAYIGFAMIAALLTLNALPFLAATFTSSSLGSRLVGAGLVASLAVSVIGLLVLIPGLLSLDQYDGQQRRDLRSSHIEGVIWLLAITAVIIGTNHVTKRLART